MYFEKISTTRIASAVATGACRGIAGDAPSGDFRDSRARPFVPGADVPEKTDRESAASENHARLD